MKRMKLTTIVQKDAKIYVALCPELDIASQGTSSAKASANLQQAIEGFFEVASATEIKRRRARVSAG
jgi:predicted RNase H-like HicB family nuclease